MDDRFAKKMDDLLPFVYCPSSLVHCFSGTWHLDRPKGDNLTNLQEMTIQSLIMLMEDSNWVLAYLNTGGIQLASKIAAFNKFVSVPKEQLLINEESNAKAVTISLDPLLKKPEAPGTVAGKD